MWGVRIDRAAQHPLAGPAVTSALAVGLLGARPYYTGHVDFGFLSWNLFLAWLPYLFTLAVARRSAPTWVLALGALPWLLLFPNAPYLVTDLIHLGSDPHAPLWFDAALFGAFACAGLLIGVRSLELASRIVRQRWGHGPSWLFVLTVAALSGFGIYLGRFVRFNSWDVMFEPGSILSEIAARFINEPIRVVGVSAIFGAFVVATYIGFARPEPTLNEGPTR